MFQRYVTSVVYRCCKSRSGCSTCCNGYTHIFQVYVPNISFVPDVCCKCFIWMLQKYIWMLHIHTCYKQIFLSVLRCFIRTFASVLFVCCICLQWFFEIFFKWFRKCFGRLFQMFHLSSFLCCNCCICMFQK
jgi:hypothetical protein